MKKCILSLALVLAMLLGLLPTAAFAAGGGDSEDDPIPITSAQELAELAAAVDGGNSYQDKFIKLTDNIDLSTICSETSGTSWTPIGTSPSPFLGNFDGGGHTVSGLYIATDRPGLFGLFGAIGNTGTVKGLTVEGSVAGPSNMGGVAGVNYGTITDCHNAAAVTGDSSRPHVGGIAGENYGTIARCSNSRTGAITGVCTSGTAALVLAGGIAGYNEGTIQNCFNLGPIACTAAGYAGGVAGHNSSGTVENCYNAFTVQASGGAAAYGLCRDGTVINSYYDTSKVNATDGGGIPGTDFMDQDQYFTGWDFINVWRMDATVGRPVLRVPGDPVAHAHPVCGAEACPHDGPHSDIVWAEWTDGTTLPDRVGNFYLTTDVALSGTWRPKSGTRLCLNGHSITQSTARYLALLINEGAVFGLSDCKNAGTVTSNGREGASCLGDFSLYGGKISGNTAASGVTLVSGATFHMYGGEISDNGSTGLTSGGGVNVEGGAFHLHGGKITGNTAGTGGGVSVGRGGTFTMLGGEISGNSAVYSCGGVAFTQGGTLTVGGQAVIADNTAGDQPSNFGADYDTQITISQPLTQGARIGVIPYGDPPTAARWLDVTTGANDADYSMYFHSDDPAYEIVNGAGNVVQLIPYVKYRLSQQPTANNGYTVAAQERGENGDWVDATATYQWYETQSKVYSVTDAAGDAISEGALGANVGSGTDAGDGKWNSVDGWITLQFADGLTLKAGDTITARPSPDFSGECMVMGTGNPEMLMPGENGVYSYVMPEDGPLTFGLQADNDFSATITVTRTTRAPVEGQDAATLGITWGNKTYVCAVTFDDGKTLLSEAVTVPLFQGEGTEESPYLIPDLAALEAFRDYINEGGSYYEHFRLTANVDLASVYSEDTGVSWTPIGTREAAPFSGTFDGDGHTIQNLYINATERGYFGLFDTIDSAGTVKNLKVNGTLKAVGHNNVYLIGGVAGKNDGVISNCHSACAIESPHYGGGIVGVNAGRMEGCRNTGTVTATVDVGFTDSISALAGGIAGENAQGTIARCYNAGNIQGVYIGASEPGSGTQGSIKLQLGGIAGTTNAAILNCYNTGTVTAAKNGDYVGHLGGVAGWNGGGSVQNSYNVGGVSGSSSASIGGVVGSGTSTVTSSYYDRAKVTPTTSGSDGTGIDADAFRAQATFVDWDFSSTWELDAVLGRPVLRGASPHAHQWTYAVDGATISQSDCAAEGCHLSGGGSVTLAAPTGDLIYNGGAHDATLTGAFQGLETPEITYQRRDTELGTYEDVTDTIAAGWYKASVMAAGETATVTYQVAKAAPTVDTPDALTARYGQTLRNVILPQGWAWDEPSTGLNTVGTFPFPATFTPSDTNNYLTVAQNLTVEVQRLGNRIVLTCENITYGERPAPVASADYGTVAISYGRSDTGPFDPSWDATNGVGRWYVRAFAAEGDYYESAEAVEPFQVLQKAEDTPSAIRIDYINETLTGFVAGAKYTINDGEVTPVESTVPVGAYLDQEVTIVRLARDGNHKDSEPVTLSVPARPGPPENLEVTAESIQGRSDGKITGLDTGTAYQFSDDGGRDWVDADVTAEGEIVGLPPGEYRVRTKADPGASAFAGEAATLTVDAGGPRTYTLTVTAPTFAEVYEGYARPEALSLPIQNSGNSDATVYRVAVDSDAFVIGGSGRTVPAGGFIETWTVQPVAGLAVGTHSANVTVTYNEGDHATAEVTFTVRALNHNWSWTITQDPTMDVPGRATHSCQGDDYHDAHSETGVEVPALSDTAVWTEDETQRVEPTDTEDGSRTYTSGYGTVTVILPSLGHTHAPAFVEGQPADCENDGWMGYYACRCDTYFVDVAGEVEIPDLEAWKLAGGKLPALGHAWGEWVVTTPADCETAGVETSICGNDPDHTKTRPIDALGHAWGEWVVTTPTDCETAGVETSICGNDPDHTKTRTIDAKGHAWGEWRMKTEPSLTAAGTAERVCGHDNSHKETKPIPALTDPAVWTLTEEQPPTEDQDGSRTYTSDYGTVTVVVPALGHTHAPAFVEGQAPDCENDGWMGYYACRCDTELVTYFEDAAGQTVIPDLEAWKLAGGKLDALGHAWGEWVTDETHHWKLCSVCGQQGSYGAHVYTDDQDATCDTCGYTKTEDPPKPPTPSRPGSRPSGYTPGIQQPDHGTITVSPASPTAGDQVTVTLTPDVGYAADTVTVTDRNGKSVKVTRNADGTYTFTQPTGAVTISVTVKEAACPKDRTCPIRAFRDASVDGWYHDGIHFCVERGLMKGVSKTAFAPGIPTSRAMVATILWRLQGSPVVNYAMEYADVKDGTWYTEAVRWATREGIVKGYNTDNFGPEDAITRQQLAAMLYRYEQKFGGGGFTGSWRFPLDFSDRADISDWAYEALCWMTTNQVMEGKGDKVLDPAGQATRAEVATMIQRFLTLK